MKACPKCYKQVPLEEVNFCDDCGVPLVAVSSEESSTPAFMGAPSTNEEPDPPSEIDEKGRAAPHYDLKLEINTNRFYMAGKKGILDLRLSNRGIAKTDRLNLLVSADFFAQPEIRSLSLGAGETVNIKIPLRASNEDAGENLFFFSIESPSDLEPIRWSGEKELSIYDRPPKKSRNVYDMRNLVSIHGEKVGFGQEIKLELNELFEKGVLKTPNDLMDYFKDAEPKYQEIPLRREVGSIAPTLPCLASAPLLGDLLLLRIHTGSSNRNVLFFARPALQFGRTKEVNDVVLRCLPANDENNRLSRLIGRNHFQIGFEGDSFFLADRGSRNGTFLKGVRIKGRKRFSNEVPTTVKVADAIELRLWPIGWPSDVDLSVLPQKKHRLDPPLAGVRVERIGNLAGQEEYILVQGPLLIGAWLGAAISAGEEGENKLAAIVHEDGCWRFLNLSDKTWTQPGGASIGPGNVVGLDYGWSATRGSTKIEILELQQIYL